MLMKRIALVFFLTSVVLLMGCWPGPGPSGPSGGPATPTPTILAQGTKAANAGVATQLVTVTVNQKGTLKATITWSGAPATMVAYFKHGGPQNHGWVQSASPLDSTVQITSAPSGGWNLYVANSSGPNRTVSYVVTFLPD
jgi:hypothetical protein